jgi:hypothetical protein
MLDWQSRLLFGCLSQWRWVAAVPSAGLTGCFGSDGEGIKSCWLTDCRVNRANWGKRLRARPRFNETSLIFSSKFSHC